MIPIILSAGRGSRVGAETKEIPKWFLDITDKHSVYDYQLASLEEHFDTAYVVLGHGFDSKKEAHAAVPTSYDIDVEPLVFEEWNKVENAGSAAYALKNVPKEDLLLICGDIIPMGDMVTEVLQKYETEIGPRGHSAVVAFEGKQDEKTAVRWNSEGIITDYGAIKGHEEAGFFILNRNHLEAACSIWKENKDEWFPSIFPKVDSQAIRMDKDDQFEVNTKSDLVKVRNYLTDKPIHKIS